MPNLRDIRRRIRSIQNTGKVTKAMEMIAASKLRRTQVAALAARPYSDKIFEVIGHLAAQPTDEAAGTQPLLERRPVNNIEVLHITPDRGLCGGLHGNLNGMVGQFILSAPAPVRLVCVGRKGRDFMVRYGRDVRATFMNISDRLTLADTLAISHIAIDDYTSGEADEVYLAYPESISTISQRPVLKKLLPIEPSDLPATRRVGYIYEPTSPEVLGSLLPRFVEMQLYHALLELIASEQSARMVAMRNASDSAGEMVGDLTLTLNKVRQESITNELLDLASGSATQSR
jgi:F-type H+-transporting ATPase subunit gamma